MMEDGRWMMEDGRCFFEIKSINHAGTSIIGRTIVRNVVTSQCRKREATEANEGNIRCLRPKHPTIPRETSDLSNQRQVKQVVILKKKEIKNYGKKFASIEVGNGAAAQS